VKKAYKDKKIVINLCWISWASDVLLPDFHCWIFIAEFSSLKIFITEI